MGAFRYRYPVSAEIAGKLLLFLFPLPTGSHGFVPEIQFSGVPLVRLYLYFFLLSFLFIRHYDNGNRPHDNDIRRRGSDNRLLHNNSRHRLVRYSLPRCLLRHSHSAGYTSHREGHATMPTSQWRRLSSKKDWSAALTVFASWVM